MSDTCSQCGEEFEQVAIHMSNSSTCELTEEVLIDELKRLAGELGETPSAPDMNERGRFSDVTYHKKFGSWNAALKDAGLELNQGYSIGEDRLLDELRRLAEELGKTPSRNEAAKYGTFSYGTYVNYFGSWNESLKKAGLKAIKEYPIEPEWADGVEDYYGESWPQKREEAVERDDHECQVCGSDGLLHVHHITPRRMFEYPDGSNTLDNLVTLCASCHMTYEGQWTDADVETFVENARDAYGFAEESAVQTELREPIFV